MLIISGVPIFRIFTVIVLNNGAVWLNNARMCPKDAAEMANSVDPDQTFPDLGLQCLIGPVCFNT